MPDYPPGTPSWVDLGTTDLDAAAAFYGELFGWEAEASEDPAAGGYRQFMLGGKAVAGLSPLFGDQQQPWWTTYIAVANADETAAKVGEGGGQVMMEPFDVLQAGRMAVFADSVGAVCGIWQPGEHSGAELVNGPGSFNWNELRTREPDKGREFYGAVFGWDFEILDLGPEPYTRWLLGGSRVAGMVQMGDSLPDEVPSHWGVYFAVEDTDAAVGTAEGAGGKVTFPPFDAPVGRFASLSDPQGATFSVITLAGEALDVAEAQAAALGAS